jgi:hypothetical protein
MSARVEAVLQEFDAMSVFTTHISIKWPITQDGKDLQEAIEILRNAMDHYKDLGPLSGAKFANS